jgi:hypothetical protein
MGIELKLEVMKADRALWRHELTHLYSKYEQQGESKLYAVNVSFWQGKIAGIESAIKRLES